MQKITLISLIFTIVFFIVIILVDIIITKYKFNKYFSIIPIILFLGAHITLAYAIYKENNVGNAVIYGLGGLLGWGGAYAIVELILTGSLSGSMQFYKK